MVGAAALAYDGLQTARRRADAGAAVSAGRLIVCPTPIGNLEDVTLRVLAALREADLVACEDTRRTRVLLDRYGVGGQARQLPRAQRACARRRAGRRGCSTGAVVALVSDAGMPLVSDPGLVLVRACVAAGLGVEVLPGPSAALQRAGRQRPAGRALAVRRLPAAQARASWQRCWRRPRRVVAFESPRRLGASLSALAARRPRPPGRRLPRADQAPRGDRARDRGRARRALRRRAARRARSCSSSGPPPRPRRTSTRPLDALRRLVDAGAKPRPAAGVVAELTGVSANALYRALHRRRGPAQRSTK